MKCEEEFTYRWVPLPILSVGNLKCYSLIDAKELRVLLVFDEKSEYPGAVSIKTYEELTPLLKKHLA